MSSRTDYYSKVSSAYNVVPDYIEDCMQKITDIYTERSVEIRKMQEMYSR